MVGKKRQISTPVRMNVLFFIESYYDDVHKIDIIRCVVIICLIQLTLTLN
jgi:hypothetical protein